MSSLHEQELRSIVDHMLTRHTDFAAAHDLRGSAGTYRVSVTRIAAPVSDDFADMERDELCHELTEAINHGTFQVVDCIETPQGFTLHVTTRFREYDTVSD